MVLTAVTDPMEGAPSVVVPPNDADEAPPPPPFTARRYRPEYSVFGVRPVTYTEVEVTVVAEVHVEPSCENS